MIQKNYQREHVRAPFNDKMFFKDQDYVYKAKIKNISSGGLLLSEIPFFPKNDQVQVFFYLPKSFYWENADIHEMKKYLNLNRRGHIIQTSVTFVREEEKQFSIEDIFQKNFGLKFLALNPQDKLHLEDYAQKFKRNLSVLSLWFEMMNEKKNEYVLRFHLLSKILGYNWKSKSESEIRDLIKHDLNDFQ